MDPYEVLGLEPGADRAQIQRAYRSLAREFHPDRFATSQPHIAELAARRMADINVAHQVLTDPEAARRHRHSEMRRDAATGRPTRGHDRGTVFATSADTAAPGPGPSGGAPAEHEPRPDFDYRRDAAREFDGISEDTTTSGDAETTDDDGASPHDPEVWTMQKPSRGLFRRR